MGSTFTSPRTVLATAVAFLATLALMAAPSARSDQLPSLVDLGPITVLNGTATLAGTLGGDTAASTELTVNGQPLAVDAAGHFAGTVSLDGQTTVNLSLRNPVTGETSQFSIPLSTSVAGIIPQGTISAVEQAVASLLRPADGFKILDGLPLTLEGRLVDGSDLASLKVNGIDVLGALNPDGTYTVQVPGTTKEISVTATDKQGTTETNTYGVSQVVSTRQGLAVAAGSAVGLKIAKIRYITKRVTKTRRLRMIVTLKDNLGRLVSGATVQIRSSKAGRTLRRQQTKKSSKVGQAAFTIAVRKRILGKRLVIVTNAKTPTAKAKKTSSVRLPRVRAVRKHR